MSTYSYPYHQGAWSEEEERRLRSLVRQHGTADWTKISTHLRSRSARQCREHYDQNRPQWLDHGFIMTPEERREIEELVDTVGQSVDDISLSFLRHQATPSSHRATGPSQPRATPSNQQGRGPSQPRATPSNHGITAGPTPPSSGQTSTTKRKVEFVIMQGVSILMFAGIAGAILYLIIYPVERVSAQNAAKPHSASWSQDARERAYEPCYNGCAGSVDRECAFHACETTANVKVNVTGVICDGNQMWNWQDRYPDACLEALGGIYKAEAEERLFRSVAWRASLIALPIVVGLIVFALLCWRSIRYYKRKYATAASTIPLTPITSGLNSGTHVTTSSTIAGVTTTTGSRIRAGTPAPPAYLNVGSPPPRYKRPGSQGTSQGNSIGKSGESNSTFRQIPAILGIAALFGRASATGGLICKDNVTIRHFTNANRTIFGDVRGWLASECSEYPCRCRDVKCPPSQGRIVKPSKCEQKCDKCTRYTTGSLEFVDRIKPKVGLCEFEFIHGSVGEAPWRVANAMIEKNWLVTISLNTFNVSGETDGQVRCLHAIGEQWP